MTAVYPTETASSWAAAPSASPSANDRIAARRETLTALDSFVRPLLREQLTMPHELARASVDLTVYDQVYRRRAAAGGHWDVASRSPGLVGHTISSYAVTLHFAAADRPSHFVIDGAGRIETTDATPESLARGLDLALRGGPLITWAPSFMPGVSL